MATKYIFVTKRRGQVIEAVCYEDVVNERVVYELVRLEGFDKNKKEDREIKKQILTQYRKSLFFTKEAVREAVKAGLKTKAPANRRRNIFRWGTLRRLCG